MLYSQLAPARDLSITGESIYSFLSNAEYVELAGSSVESYKMNMQNPCFPPSYQTLEYPATMPYTMNAVHLDHIAR